MVFLQYINVRGGSRERAGRSEAYSNSPKKFPKKSSWTSITQERCPRIRWIRTCVSISPSVGIHVRSTCLEKCQNARRTVTQEIGPYYVGPSPIYFQEAKVIPSTAGSISTSSIPTSKCCND